jgi:hypothetical protein
MGDMVGLSRIPQLHGRLFATRIPIVLRLGAFRFPSTEIQRMACLHDVHRSQEDVKACSIVNFR